MQQSLSCILDAFKLKVFQFVHSFRHFIHNFNRFLVIFKFLGQIAECIARYISDVTACVIISVLKLLQPLRVLIEDGFVLSRKVGILSVNINTLLQINRVSLFLAFQSLFSFFHSPCYGFYLFGFYLYTLFEFFGCLMVRLHFECFQI